MYCTRVDIFGKTKQYSIRNIRSQRVGHVLQYSTVQIEYCIVAPLINILPKKIISKITYWLRNSCVRFRNFWMHPESIHPEIAKLKVGILKHTHTFAANESFQMMLLYCNVFTIISCSWLVIISLSNRDPRCPSNVRLLDESSFEASHDDLQSPGTFCHPVRFGGRQGYRPPDGHICRTDDAMAIKPGAAQCAPRADLGHVSRSAEPDLHQSSSTPWIYTAGRAHEIEVVQFEPHWCIYLLFELRNARYANRQWPLAQIVVSTLELVHSPVGLVTNAPSMVRRPAPSWRTTNGRLDLVKDLKTNSTDVITRPFSSTDWLTPMMHLFFRSEDCVKLQNGAFFKAPFLNENNPLFVQTFFF